MKRIIILILTLILLIGCREQHIFWSYFGIVDTDTLQYAFDDFIDKEPCYIVHTEIIDGDTINYYLYPWKGIHYRDLRDSTGRMGIVQWEPYIKKEMYDSTWFHYIK